MDAAHWWWLRRFTLPNVIDYYYYIYPNYEWPYPKVKGFMGNRLYCL